MTRVARVEVVALLAVTLATAGIRIAIAVQDGGASLFFDEAYYLDNARAIAALGPYAIAHYPPLYSLLIAPGLLTPDWYPAVLALSATASALTVPAAWFLGRSVGLRRPIFAALAAAALPSALAYAGFLMSENLSTPLFVTAVALACRGRRQEGWLVGLVAAALALTKYLFIPAVLVLVLVYLIRCRRASADPWSPGTWARRIAAVAAPIVALGVAWLAYGLASGLSLLALLGSTDPSGTLTRGATEGRPLHLIFWALVYGAIILLPTLPTAFLALVHLTRRRAAPDPLDPGLRTLLVAAAALTALHLAIATQHSFGASYNIPDPQRAWGRYVMHLTPVLLVLGFGLLERYAGAFRRGIVRAPVVVGALVAVLAAAAAGWALLFRGWLFELPAYGSSAPLVAADVFPFRTAPTLLLFAGATVAVAIAVVVPVRRTLVAVAAATAIVAVFAVTSVGYLLGSFPNDGYAPEHAASGGSLARKMFELADREGGSDASVTFVVGEGFDLGRMDWQLRFWDRPAGSVVVEQVAESGVPYPGAPQDADAVRTLLDELAATPACDGVDDVCYLVLPPIEGVEFGELDDRWGQPVRFFPVP